MTTATISRPQSTVTFGEPRLRTDGDVLVITFGKDGLLYSVEELGILRKWDPASGKQLDSTALSDLETLWAFSADGRLLASASNDLAIWDVAAGQLITSIPQQSWVSALAFHPDSNFLVVGHDDGAITCWDAAGHDQVFQRDLTFHKKPISALAISPDGKKLAAACEDKTISLWDATTSKYLGCLTGHTDRIPALAWHPSSKFLVSVGWDTTARVWDADTLQPVILLNTHAIQVNALAFSRDGRWLACADSGHTIHVWDFDTKKTVYKLKAPQAEVRTLVFSPDGKYLAANGDRILHLWNPATGQPYADIGPAPLARTTVSLHPDGSKLLTNSGGGGASQIWNTVSGQSMVTLDSKESINALAYSPDGKWIAGAVGRRIRLWDASGKVCANWDEFDHPITSLAFSSDSSLLATGSRDGISVWVWRVASGEPILNIQDALDGCSIEALAFHPDGNHLAVGGIDRLATAPNDGAVCVWSLSERAEVTAFFEGATALAMHPSGDTLASTTLDNCICIWELNAKQLLQELAGHDATVTALAFSADGKYLASGSEDLTLRLWDTRGREICTVEVESQPTNLVFSADGKFLYAGHANTTCSQFQLPDLLRRR